MRKEKIVVSLKKLKQTMPCQPLPLSRIGFQFAGQKLIFFQPLFFAMKKLFSPQKMSNDKNAPTLLALLYHSAII